ncbi:SPX domain-containing protein [Phycomyces blakesleeanus]|uniref:SPX domain-containing protein n=1 Tax=Phycomyces blakesleeanus TaxID=4837 RepID=A0ABR3AVN7_PHYBL
MKFAKQLETESEDIPSAWRPYLIQYRTLKKLVAKVADEIENRGLSATFLRETLESDTVILIKELMNLAVHDQERQHMMHAIAEEGLNIKETQNTGEPDEIMDCDEEISTDDPHMKTLVLELEQDDEFFYTLMMEMDLASKLQATTSDKFKLDIDGLESQMAKVVSKNKRTMRSVQKSKQQMTWFMNQIESKRLATKLKSKSSKIAFEQFIGVNTALITMKHYQALNHTAMTKILKKHDKRSGLTASQNFPEIAKVKKFFDQKMAHILCALLTEKLISIILQPEDFSCPVCMWVAWRPIRLVCGHVFCVRCLIKQQRAHMDSCPVCRHPTAVKLASAIDLDLPRQNLLKQYFPKEIKQKRRENEREQAIEDVQAMTGRIYTEEQLMQMQRHPNGKCSIM